MLDKKYVIVKKTCILNRVCVIIRVVYYGWYRNGLYRKQIDVGYIVYRIQSLKMYYPLRSV